MRGLFSVILLFLSIFLINYSIAQENNDLLNGDYLSDKLIIKINEEYSEYCQINSIEIPPLMRWIKEAPITKVKKVFPYKHQNEKMLEPKNKNEVRIDNIYYFHLETGANIPFLLEQLKKFPFIEYAEPNYINHLTYTPSDSLNDKQWYLYAVKAFEAWDIEKGDSNIIIAISDTGIDTSHADLMENLAYNWDDPINGNDDDHDGFIDNFYGWNTGSNNNNVHYTHSAHGSNVAGIAAAATDNVRGISGAGFNSRLMIIKIDNAEGQLSGAYESIVYAADHGAFIINCSWGSYTQSEFAEDIINYAAINKGALIFCGAGNGPFRGDSAGIGVETTFYPAAYENAVAVGSTIPGDTLKTSSNYGYWLDIFAPGEDMLTTTINASYGMNGGTSMASPLVSGGAALIKSHFPHYNNKAVLLQLKNTSDFIEDINEERYRGKTGSGRVNFYRALTDTTFAGILMENIKISSGIDDNFINGDSIFISADFINYLKDANNVKITISTEKNDLQVISNQLEANQLLNGDTLNNLNEPFIFKIPHSTPLNTSLLFKVKLSADNFEGVQYFKHTVNNDFITVEENNLRVTFSSKAGIGLADKRGEGIKYKGKGPSLLYEGSFAIAENPNTVFNEFRGVEKDDNDFSIKEVIKKKNTKNNAGIELNSTFINKGIQKYEIYTYHHVYKNKLPNTAFYIYQIINKGEVDLKNLFAGMFLDWDIVDYSKNKIGYDASRKMSIAFATDTSLYCAVKILNEEVNANHYAIDNVVGGSVEIDLSDGFSTQEKYIALSQMRDSAGTSSPTGNDILDAISVGPFDLKRNDSYIAAFAILVSDDLDSLKAEADSAQALYNRLELNRKGYLPLGDQAMPIVYPNPTSSTINFEFNIENANYYSIKLFDLSGKLVLNRGERKYEEGIYREIIPTQNLKTGQYVLQLKGGKQSIEQLIVIIRE